MFVLDTNIISELRRPEKANARVLAWSGGVAAQQFYLSAITILEIELGARLIARKDEAPAALLRSWIDDDILPRFDGRILPIDTAVAQRAADLHVPDRRPDRDAFIAATALVHAMTVVTRNIVDFKPMGVMLLNPWEAP